MKQFQRGTYFAYTNSDFKMQFENFSSSIVLPTRKQNSIFQNHEDNHLDQSDTDNSSLLIPQNSYSSLHFQNKKQINQNIIQSNKIDISSISSPIKILSSSRKGQVMNYFFFQQSDSLLNRFNPLQSYQKQQFSSNHILVQHQEELIAKKNDENFPKQQEITIYSNSGLQSIEERFSQIHFSQALLSQTHQNPQITKPKSQIKSNLQSYQILQSKQIIEQRSNYLVEWPEVFDQSTMMQLYHKYSPNLRDDEQILLLMKAINQTAQSKMCGKMFMECAFKLYNSNYGKMNEQEFNLKVIGDVLYLFRNYNQKREKYEIESLSYEQKERKIKRIKQKFE